MDKRSALVTAGGLTASFVAGIAAVSFNWGLVGSSSAATKAAAASPTPTPAKPIIKHRTIVVHKKPKPTKAPPPVRTVTLPAPTTNVAPAPSHPVTSTGGSPTTGGDDGHEHGDD